MTKRVNRLSRAALAGLAGMTITAVPAFAQDLGSWDLQTTPETTAAAIEAATADAARDGGSIAAPESKKIGLILLSMQSPANFRIANAAEEIGALFGYEVIVCDPDFDSQRVIQCATSIMAQRPDAILSDAHEPAALGAALNDATAEGIPWFSLVVNVSEHPGMFQYGITGREVGTVYDDWLLNTIKARKGPDAPLKVMAIGAPVLGAALVAQEEQLAEDIAAFANAELTVQHDLDLGNAVQDTLSITSQTYDQNPDLGGVWTVCDFCVPLMAQVFDQKELEGDARPVVGGNYTTPQTVQLIRDGKVDGVVDIPFEASLYVVFDQLLQYWARGTDISTNPAIFAEGYGIKLMEPYMVTSENVGNGPAIPIFGDDYDSYFRTKWQIEFGVGD